MREEFEETRSNVMRFVWFMLIVVGVCAFVSSLSSCTYSITMVHTEGTASDVVDETATNSPDVRPDITIPITP